MDITPRKAGFAPERLDRIEAHLMRHYIEPRKIAGCQIAVMRRGRDAYFKSFGEMDRERAKPMSDDAIFRIYSMTKPITSVALMSLYETGAFQLDDPVSRFFPEWRNQRVYESGTYESMVLVAPERPPSMRDLMCHTAGLTYGDVLVRLGIPSSGHPVDRAYAEIGVRRGPDETLEQFGAKLGQTPLRYQPGERWLYSLATDMCGALVERLSGKRFDRYLQETVFGPLRMTDTAFFVPPEKIARFTANYARMPDKQLRLIDDPERSAYLREPTFLSGGGGLVGTTVDYLRFTEMLRNGGELDGARILGPRTVEMMRMNHLKGRADLLQMAIPGFSEAAEAGVGFGLGLASTQNQIVTGALGADDFYWGGAASTIFWVDPKEEMSVVFMTQLMPSGSFNFRGQLKNIIYSALID